MRNVWIFFYGSFMNAAVLAEAGVHPRERQVAYLDGWELRISPRATLTPAQGSRVYGILAQLTHEEIDKLYTKDWFGFGVYLPEAVMVSSAAAGQLPAMCYIAWRTEGGRPTPEYIEKMVSVAREHSFPEEYVRHMESFASRG
jgi:cation transport regulator ChaC